MADVNVSQAIIEVGHTVDDNIKVSEVTVEVGHTVDDNIHVSNAMIEVGWAPYGRVRGPAIQHI